MRFRISHSVTNGISLVHLHDEELAITVSIAPDHGAMLHAFIVKTSDGPCNVISNYSSEEEIGRQLNRSYKSSKLSPFPCRIHQAKYSWDGVSYEFANKFPDGTAIHGLLFNKPFSIREETVTDFMASAAFEYNYKGEDAGYPFQYNCTIRYTLLPNQTLQLQTSLTNHDQKAIPMADGWHPYFRFNSPIDECQLQFPSAGTVEFNRQLIPTGNILPFDSFNETKTIGSLELDNCFLIDPAAGQPVCVFSHPIKKIALRFITDEQYPYLQIYTPPDRQSIAIENLSAAPDCFNNKIGLLLLEPGVEKTFTLHYEIITGETA
ncbi:aldose 1-epimerase [Flavihumibacter stibioxidans]|uniref:Aldose 1-epimerase n=1 Tax=Flavihumibacter stibioxidans TaxID=1834163 RepID=A0ABR7M977_9BACT|nr:aldose 1-epimerase [Flavihumibacter stibioxidans]MBC6491079.1 hypothetical protein [Flavihumibacter stibioxidans]